jgi:transcription elongation factor Elf1
MDVTVELHCDHCGSANLTLPARGDDGGTIACNDCGERHGTLAELKEELLDCALAHSAAALREGLDRLP